MPIVPVKLWVVECDLCHRKVNFGGGPGYTVFDARKDARKMVATYEEEFFWRSLEDQITEQCGCQRKKRKTRR